MHTSIYTIFTEADGTTREVYAASEQVKVRLELQTAGPVAVGTDQSITPVLSGRGILLTTGVEREFILSSGDRLYIAAETIDRVAFIVEPIPYLPQITHAVQQGFGTLPHNVGSEQFAKSERPVGPPSKGRAAKVVSGQPKRPMFSPKPRFKLPGKR